MILERKRAMRTQIFHYEKSFQCLALRGAFM
jgi:hypothetical protein